MLELLCALPFLGLMALFYTGIWIFDRVTTQRMHERLGERTAKLAAQFPIDSPLYKECMAIARYHIHKAGYDNGFTMDELGSDHST